ncbi:MAG TPA: SDR family NAD(P)-dependent oxidoreductase, partial [Gammaproteobacteria bacterium]|nr:SDR family NAD(P)-dependent oxidoreductase [Gammaproteobacteria bacterium]
MKPFKKNLIISIALFAMSLPLISFADDEIGTVFITGANRGIGLEFTKQYLEKGWTVIATARKPDKAEDLNQLQNQYPEHLSIQQLDVTDHDRIDALAKELEGQPI